MPIVPIILGVGAASGVAATIGAGVATAIGIGTVSTITATAIGTGIIAGGLTAVQGGSAGDVLKSAVLGGVGSFIGGTIGEAVFGSAGSGVSQAALDAANATADPIAALNAIQGWTTSDLSYLTQIGASDAIIQAAIANNAVLTAGQVPQTSIPQSAIEAANLTNDPIAALNASQGWTANDIGYLFDIGADRALIDTAIANNINFGIQPSVFDQGIQNWMNLDAATQSTLLAQGVDPTQAYRTIDGGFGYQTADGLGVAVNPVTSYSPGYGMLADGTIGIVDEAAYLRDLGYDPARFEYRDLGGGSSQIVPKAVGIDADLLSRINTTQYAQTYGVDTNLVQDLKNLGYTDNQIFNAINNNPNGGWAGQVFSEAPGAAVAAPAPTPAPPAGSFTQIFDDGSTLTTSPTGSVTTTPATDFVTAPAIPSVAVSPDIVSPPSEPVTQIFDDGSTLTTGPAGEISATPATDLIQPIQPSLPTGPTVTANPDGSTTQIFDDGSTLTTQPTGQVTTTPATDLAATLAPTMPSGPTVQNNPDGSTTQTFDDGSTLTTSPTGQVSSTPATDTGTGLLSGPTVKNNPDGSTTQTFDDGSTLTTGPDGSVTSTPATNIGGGAVGGFSEEVLKRLGLEGLSANQILGLMAAGALAPDVLRALGVLPEEPVATGPNYGEAYRSNLPKLTDKDLVMPGIQPGLMPVQPYYQTTRPEQPQYYWGVRPYAESQADLAKMQLQIPGAPEQPFGYDVRVPQGFDVQEFIRQTITPQQTQALAGAGGQYNIYGQPTVTPTTAASPAPAVEPMGPPDPFAEFYASPEYAAFNQQNGENMFGTMDMYNSPYFGMQSSGSIGRAQDRAYEQYLARTGQQARPITPLEIPQIQTAPVSIQNPAPADFTGPVAPQTVMQEAAPLEILPYVYTPSFGIR